MTVACVSGAEATVQAQSMFGNRGPASQIGTNLRGSVVGQGTSMGVSGSIGLTGQPLTSQGLGGQGTTGGLMGNSALGLSGGTLPGAQSTGFIGRSDNASRFVGNQQAGQQSTQRGTTRQFGTFGAAGQQGRFTGAAFGGESPGGVRADRSRPVLRPRQEIAFSYSARPPATITTTLNSRFDRMSERTAPLNGVSVVVDADGTAVLSGEVATAEDGKLAAMMARLEPGVRSVRNELTVRDAAAAP